MTSTQLAVGTARPVTKSADSGAGPSNRRRAIRRLLLLVLLSLGVDFLYGRVDPRVKVRKRQLA